MLSSLGTILADRRAHGAAAGAFTCYDVGTAVAVIRAAEEAGAPALLLISSQAYAAPSGEALLAALVAVADRAIVPVCVQLDHVADLDAIERAIDQGAGAVMADGSRLPYEENVALCRRAGDLAAARGAEIEVELGHIAGDEEVAVGAVSGQLTDPGQAADFVARTGAACLAVSIGNVHGRYAAPPSLDVERLAEIRRRVDVPLSLHGASGLPDDVVTRCIDQGIAKINVNTELRAALLGALEIEVPRAREDLRVLDVLRATGDAVQATVRAKLATFGRAT